MRQGRLCSLAPVRRPRNLAVSCSSLPLYEHITPLTLPPSCFLYFSLSFFPFFSSLRIEPLSCPARLNI
ncbi:hypothetical protein AG1IA_10165 [Rhizoctonia solani AG-1 IA]|uniref:Uncharacterized protein n=1 Tax=Thanatephorus cucumeris (strain AG1-IA) TaxID=983506 RepID=L8WCZ2_THACA|nr:hypothetical protein AG1IA_10165 [Rhizoctonia solani AG-1 IA]